ncbi:MAG: TIM44-like domain-containing protein [Polyangiaceae bacterium]
MIRSRHIGIAALVIASFSMAPAVAELQLVDARPGGGQSFGGSSRGSSGSGSGSGSSGSRSGGGSSRSDYGSSGRSSSPSTPYGSGGGSSGGGGGESFVLVFGAAVVFIVLWVLVSNGVLWTRTQGEEPWQSSVPEPERTSAPPQPKKPKAKKPRTSIKKAIASVGGRDHDFSDVVFEDFLYSLYAEVHRARGSKRLEQLRPYLRAGVEKALEAHTVEEVRDIIIGSMRITQVTVDTHRRVQVVVTFTTNYTERHQGRDASYYVEERWRLSRSVDTPSRKPESARVIGCPNCGAPLERQVASKCKYCGVVTTDGDHDWRVEDWEILDKEERGPILTGTTEEVGTNDPTIVAPDARAELEALQRADPNMKWGAFSQRIELVFTTFHEAWSTQDLTPVRPLLSDALYDTQRYWVETYRAQGLQNKTEERELQSIQLSRVTRDKYYDAVTVRVFASCIDYTVDKQGKVVGGDRETPRLYSEYWTLIRAAGKVGVPRSEPGCPNCGAPAESINQAGTCKSCKAEITRGQFDWVLSRIEQDEVYRL